jgi:predicted metal-dependent phosphoesterase TrpH
MSIIKLLILLFALTILRSISSADQERVSSWYRGDTHTHTLNSDGDSTPNDVVTWYRQHGYDFVFITDHDGVTEVEPLNALLGGSGKFLVIRGEEVTSNSTVANLHVHVNVLNPDHVVSPQIGATPRETLQKDLDVIHTAGGLAQINHPNFFWQLTADDIATSKGARLIEIANMHPIVNTLGPRCRSSCT